MNDNLTDQQQAEIVKKWLKDNGLFIITSFGIAISGVFGLQYYQEGISDPPTQMCNPEHLDHGVGTQ